jgi:hypothetical protein
MCLLLGFIFHNCTARWLIVRMWAAGCMNYSADLSQHEGICKQQTLRGPWVCAGGQVSVQQSVL